MKESWKLSNSRVVLLIFALSGMTALIYEIVWIRPLTLVFGTTIYATSIIIASFLLGLSLGSFLAGKFADRMSFPLRFYGIAELGIGAYGIMIVPIFSILPGLYLEIYNATYPNHDLFWVVQFFLSFLIVLPPTTMMGTTLPFVMRVYSGGFAKVGNDLGRLYSVNNIGAVAGALSAGFVFLPILGIKESIMASAIINFGLCISSLLFSKSSARTLFAAIAIIASIMALSFFFTYDYKALSYGVYYYAFPGLQGEYLNSFLKTEKVDYYKESMYSTVGIVSDQGIHILTVGGKTQCSSDYIDRQEMQMVAAIPYYLYEENYGKPRTALVVGLGCGSTSAWLSSRTNTTTVEIDPAIAQASKTFYDSINERLVIDDARNWLARHDTRFDIIASQPREPFSEQGYLFTHQYFELLHSRINQDGMVSVWVPVYVMSVGDLLTFYNTFHLSFPYVYAYANDTYGANVIFVGSDKPLKIGNTNLLELDRVIVKNNYGLNTDNRPIIEFSTAAKIYNRNYTTIFEKFSEWANHTVQ